MLNAQLWSGFLAVTGHGGFSAEYLLRLKLCVSVPLWLLPMLSPFELESRFRLLMRVVRASDQRSGFHVREALGEADRLEVCEFVRVPVANHRRMLRRGPQILANRENRYSDRAEIVENRDDLVELLAHTYHHPGLRRSCRLIAAGAVEKLQ